MQVQNNSYVLLKNILVSFTVKFFSENLFKLGFDLYEQENNKMH